MPIIFQYKIKSTANKIKCAQGKLRSTIHLKNAHKSKISLQNIIYLERNITSLMLENFTIIAICFKKLKIDGETTQLTIVALVATKTLN